MITTIAAITEMETKLQDIEAISEINFSDRGDRSDYVETIFQRL